MGHESNHLQWDETQAVVEHGMA